MRMTPAEQLDNFAITQEVANEARETQEEFRRLDVRVVELEAGLADCMEIAGSDCEHELCRAIIARASAALRGK